MDDSVGVIARLTSTLDGNVGVGGVGVRQEHNFKAVQARTLSAQLSQDRSPQPELASLPPFNQPHKKGAGGRESRCRLCNVAWRRAPVPSNQAVITAGTRHPLITRACKERSNYSMLAGQRGCRGRPQRWPASTGRHWELAEGWGMGAGLGLGHSPQGSLVCGKVRPPEESLGTSVLYARSTS